jgi:hypothetical protein
MKKLILFSIIVFGAISLLAQTTQGGGLYVHDTQVNSSIVVENIATGEGTGIYATGTSELVNNTIADNRQGRSFDGKVGEIYEDGIIFYVDYYNRIALIVSLTEAPATVKYTYKTYGETGQNIIAANDVNDGKKNTAAMIAAQVIVPDIDSNRDNQLAANNGTLRNIKLPADTIRRAAHWCTELEESGHSDWFLPSREQLKKLYTAKEQVNGILQQNASNTLLGNGYYLSSTQADAYKAWYVFFDNGETNISTKSNVANVRAIREIKF